MEVIHGAIEAHPGASETLIGAFRDLPLSMEVLHGALEAHPEVAEIPPLGCGGYPWSPCGSRWSCRGSCWSFILDSSLRVEVIYGAFET
jgi:hypothetical protein